MVVSPYDNADLADDVGGRNCSPDAAVAGVAPAVAHHEVLAARDPGGGHIGRRLVADTTEFREPWLGQGLPVYQDGVPRRGDGLTGQTDDPLDQVGVGG